ncbi:MAG: substrate-binding domain-containing protein [Myxococcota bacterium]
MRVSSTEPMIADVLAPAAAKLLASCPAIRLELETSRELSNLNRGDADIAVRMVRPEGDTLATRRLARIEMGLFASRQYLRQRRLETIDLEAERLVWYDAAYGDISENIWLRRSGLEAQVVARSGSTRALTNAAVEGLGIAPLPVFLARRASLVQLPAFDLPSRTPWLVFHRDTRRDPRLKAVRNWVVETCEAAFA